MVGSREDKSRAVLYGRWARQESDEHFVTWGCSICWTGCCVRDLSSQWLTTLHNSWFVTYLDMLLQLQFS